MGCDGRSGTSITRVAGPRCAGSCRPRGAGRAGDRRQRGVRPFALHSHARDSRRRGRRAGRRPRQQADRRRHSWCRDCCDARRGRRQAGPVVPARRGGDVAARGQRRPARRPEAHPRRSGSSGGAAWHDDVRRPSGEGAGCGPGHFSGLHPAPYRGVRRPVAGPSTGGGDRLVRAEQEGQAAAWRFAAARPGGSNAHRRARGILAAERRCRRRIDPCCRGWRHHPHAAGERRERGRGDPAGFLR